jgi:hypothetical protein
MLQLGFRIRKVGFQLPAEPVQDGKVGLVDTVHVTGNGRRQNVRGVVIANVEHIMALVLMGADHRAVERHMVRSLAKIT